MVHSYSVCNENRMSYLLLWKCSLPNQSMLTDLFFSFSSKGMKWLALLIWMALIIRSSALDLPSLCLLLVLRTSASGSLWTTVTAEDLQKSSFHWMQFRWREAIHLSFKLQRVFKVFFKNTWVSQVTLKWNLDSSLHLIIRTTIKRLTTLDHFYFKVSWSAD